MSVKSFCVTFLDNENIPMRTDKTFSTRINASGVVSATLRWSFVKVGLDNATPLDAVKLKSVSFNGSVVAHGSLDGQADVTYLLIGNGRNSVHIETAGAPLWNLLNTTAYKASIFLDVVATGSVGQIPASVASGLGNYKNWLILVGVVLVLLFLLWFLRTPHGHKVAGLIKDTGRSVASVVGGSIA